MFSFTDSSCLQDSILFLKAHWLGTWNSLDTECQAISWMNHHLKTVYTIQSIKLGHKKKQLFNFFGVLNRERPPKYNPSIQRLLLRCSDQPLRNLPNAFSFGLLSGGWPLAILGVTSYFEIPQITETLGLRPKPKWSLTLNPYMDTCPPPLFTSFNTFPGHHCHQQSVSVWRSIQKRVWTVLFSRFTCGNGLWLRAISAHDLPTPRTDPSRRTASLLGKQRLANAYLESKRCTSIYLPFNTVGLNLHGFQNELMSIWTGPGWLLRYPPIDDSS